MREQELWHPRCVSNDLFVLAWLGGAAGLGALVFGVMFATTWRRYAWLVAVGLAGGLLWFAAVLLTAGTDHNHYPRSCSDCSYVWGRWWDPPLVVFVLAINLAAWIIGATLGRLVRAASGRL